MAALDVFSMSDPNDNRSEPPRGRRRRSGSRVLRAEDERDGDDEGLDLGGLLLDDGVVSRSRALTNDDVGGFDTMIDEAVHNDAPRPRRTTTA